MGITAPSSAKADPEVLMVGTGNGSRKRLAIGGTVMHPTWDWVHLAEHVGPLLSITNPFHTGDRVHAEVSDADVELLGGAMRGTAAWHKWLRLRYRQLLFEHNPHELILHSRGCSDGLAALENGIPSNLEHIVLLAPPIAKTLRQPNGALPSISEREDETMEEFLVRQTLHTMCAGMRDDVFAAMIAEHGKHYGTRLKLNMRYESPVKTQVSEDAIRSMLSAVRQGLRLTAISGEHDPWFDDETLRRVVEGTDNIRLESIAAGHFLHISHPEAVAQKIRESR